MDDNVPYNADHGVVPFMGHHNVRLPAIRHHAPSHDDDVVGPIAGPIGDDDDNNNRVSTPVSVPYARYGNLGNYYHHVTNPYQPRHVHVGVGTPNVKVEVETSKSQIARSPAVHVSAQVRIINSLITNCFLFLHVVCA